MKTMGLIGGMSWESSLEYYRIINETVKERLGGFHSAKCILYSVDFEEVEKLQHLGDWDELTRLMMDAAQRLERAGADFVMICTNTMHKMADEVQGAIHIPVLHIVDVTAQAIKSNGQTRVGLLGTKFTMEQDFYKGRLIQKYGLNVLVPNEEDREVVHKIIYQELCLGKVGTDSKTRYLHIIDSFANQGAEAVILGCTEIGMLVNQSDTNMKLFDTTAIHAEKAVEYAI